MSYILQENDLQVNNESPILCSECQGGCCKNMGCHYSPRDFKQINIKTLKKLIDEGNTSIDWWEGDILDEDRDRTYYLRIRNKNSKIVDPSCGGECILLTEEGCNLSFFNRPMGGRALLPSEKGAGNCKTEYSKEDYCKEWYPYQNILGFLVEMYQ